MTANNTAIAAYTAWENAPPGMQKMDALAALNAAANANTDAYNAATAQYAVAETTQATAWNAGATYNTSYVDHVVINDPVPDPEPDPGDLPTDQPPILVPPFPPSGPVGPG